MSGYHEQSTDEKSPLPLRSVSGNGECRGCSRHLAPAPWRVRRAGDGPDCLLSRAPVAPRLGARRGVSRSGGTSRTRGPARPSAWVGTRNVEALPLLLTLSSASPGSRPSTPDRSATRRPAVVHLSSHRDVRWRALTALNPVLSKSVDLVLQCRRTADNQQALG
jgi:hypothetical protein